MNGNIFQGKYYRITVLTERLIRLEYSTQGIFVDSNTEFVVNRNFPKIELTVNENNKTLNIISKYFSLTYTKEKPFKGNKFNPASNLKIELLNTNRAWYYNHPEIRNYGGIKSSINGSSPTLKGLYSIDGFSSFDDSNSRVLLDNGIYSDRQNNEIDIYIFMYKNDYNLALNDYFMLTGYPELLPKYALGVWWSREYDYNEKELFELINKFKVEDIPISVLLLDKYWHYQTKDDTIDTTKYIFNDNFKNTKELLHYASLNNIKLGLNIEPSTGITYTNQFGDDILVPYNILDVEFVKSLLYSIVLRYKMENINVIWLDYRQNISDISILNQYLNRVNNYQDNRQVILSRASKYAPHRNGIVYTGRTKVGFETLNHLPFYTSRAANIGVSWISNDIGGFYGGIEDDELYIRYIQFGVFSPILRFHGGISKFYKKEPWNRSISTYHIVKEYLTLRHKLIPYLYSESYNYITKAETIIKPIYYEYKEIYDEPEYIGEYFFGSQFLICPITKKRDYMIKRTIHKFYLPEGIWYDFKTGKKFNGDTRNIGLYKKEEYPIFVKAGGIIPLNIDSNYNDQTNLDIMIFPGRNNTYQLYEDDCNTLQYKQGYYLITSINYMQNDEEINIEIKPTRGNRGIIPDYRNYKIILRNIKVPNNIICKQNNQNINFEYELKENSFVIKINSVYTLETLSIKLIGNNLEVVNIKQIENEIESTVGDLPIETPLKEKINSIIFSKKTIKEKRIEIIKLKKLIPKTYYPLILKLLDYLHNE